MPYNCSNPKCCRTQRHATNSKTAEKQREAIQGNVWSMCQQVMEPPPLHPRWTSQEKEKFSDWMILRGNRGGGSGGRRTINNKAREGGKTFQLSSPMPLSGRGIKRPRDPKGGEEESVKVSSFAYLFSSSHVHFAFHLLVPYTLVWCRTDVCVNAERNVAQGEGK